MPDFDQIVGSIYETLLDSEGEVSRLLADTADFCGAMTASLAIHDANLGWRRAVTPRVDENAMASYVSHWAAKDPVFAFAAALPEGQVGKLGRQEADAFLQSDIYHECWFASGLGVDRRFANLSKSNGFLVNLALFSDQGQSQITHEGERAYRTLLPHFSRATAIMRRQRNLERARVFDSLNRPFEIAALFVVDTEGHIAYLDDGASKLLNEERQFRVLEGRLALNSPSLNERLQNVLRPGWIKNPRALDDDVLCVESELDGRPLHIETVPFAGAFGRSLLDSMGWGTAILPSSCAIRRGKSGCFVSSLCKAPG